MAVLFYIAPVKNTQPASQQDQRLGVLTTDTASSAAFNIALIDWDNLIKIYAYLLIYV